MEHQQLSGNSLPRIFYPSHLSVNSDIESGVPQSTPYHSSHQHHPSDVKRFDGEYNATTVTRGDSNTNNHGPKMMTHQQQPQLQTHISPKVRFDNHAHHQHQRPQMSNPMVYPHQQQQEQRYSGQQQQVQQHFAQPLSQEYGESRNDY